MLLREKWSFDLVTWYILCAIRYVDMRLVPTEMKKREAVRAFSTNMPYGVGFDENSAGPSWMAVIVTARPIILRF